VRYRREEKWRTIYIGQFFHSQIVGSSSSAPTSMVGEVQLLWEDKNHDGVRLASVRLYFLPENSDEGRNPSHGQVGSLNVGKPVS